MAVRQTESKGTDQGEGRQMLKRRGILAAAGAVVAGMMAKQTAQPVAATSGGGDQGPLNLGSNPWYIAASNAANTPAISSAPTVLQASPNFSNYAGTNGADRVLFEVDARTAGFGNISAISGFAQGSGTGVYGTAGAFGTGVYGTATGTSATEVGVKGVTSVGKGVSGSSSGQGDGVYGESVGGNGVFGFYGQSLPGGVGSIGNGVYGYSDITGVRGRASAGGTGVAGQSSGSGSAGVRGSSDVGFGVFGGSGTSFGVYGQTGGTGVVAGVIGGSTTAYGIIGSTTAAGYSGLTGITSTPGVAALGATSTDPGAFAAFFTGTTVVNGNFAVTGSKSAAVAHPDGTHRLLYCVESPEAWFEDFGEAKLVGGKAEVKLDADFAALVHADSYHVFLTPHADTNGLHVASRGTTGFSIQEHRSGASSLTFSWRVVAKRKDNPGTRLEKFSMPKINHPDPDKLPKPELPKKA